VGAHCAQVTHHEDVKEVLKTAFRQQIPLLRRHFEMFLGAHARWACPAAASSAAAVCCFLGQCHPHARTL
jgi:hypothetical protein